MKDLRIKPRPKAKAPVSHPAVLRDNPAARKALSDRPAVTKPVETKTHFTEAETIDAFLLRASFSRTAKFIEASKAENNPAYKNAKTPQWCAEPGCTLALVIEDQGLTNRCLFHKAGNNFEKIENLGGMDLSVDREAHLNARLAHLRGSVNLPVI